MTTYQILIVDDEAASLAYMRGIIEAYATGYAVAAEAHDGAEALEMLSKNEPDILMTDIRMPGMDGVALAKEARRLYPRIIILMVSGYSDFEYARGALAAGAEDYLLKPLGVSQVSKKLGELHDRLDAEYTRRRLGCLSAALYGDRAEPRGLFACDRFRLAVLRKGNLSSVNRLSANAPLLIDQNDDEQWLLSGRDEQEWICIFPQDTAFENRIKRFYQSCMQSSDGLSVTLVYGRAHTLNALREGALRLLQILDERLVIGLSQLIDGTRESPAPSPETGHFLEKARQCLSVSDYPRLKELLFQWTMLCDQKAMPQRMAEEGLDRLASLAISQIPAHKGKNKQITMEIAEIMQVARSLSEAVSGVWDILFEASARGLGAESHKREELLQEITAYVREHYAEPLSVQSICTAFGVSPTYLSRLFRSGGSTTFGELLTDCRIAQAKTLLKDHGNVRLKDIAQCVGYDDPSYFIKVFKKQTGLTPTQYADDPD